MYTMKHEFFNWPDFYVFELNCGDRLSEETYSHSFDETLEKAKRMFLGKDASDVGNIRRYYCMWLKEEYKQLQNGERSAVGRNGFIMNELIGC